MVYISVPRGKGVREVLARKDSVPQGAKQDVVVKSFTAKDGPKQNKNV